VEIAAYRKARGAKKDKEKQATPKSESANTYLCSILMLILGLTDNSWNDES